MDFGIIFANTGPFAEPEAAAKFAAQAEEAGFESLWTVEHVVVPAGYESTYPYDPSGRMPGNDDASIPDPLIWLSYLAAVTSRIRLATGILIVPQRNPLVLAKELATLDSLSQGRVEFGMAALYPDCTPSDVPKKSGARGASPRAPKGGVVVPSRTKVDSRRRPR